MLQKHIFLIGFMGAGKTAVSKKLASMTGEPLVDTDERIVEEAGMEISRMFDSFGEEYFRNFETGVLKKICAEKPCIVSCGGGLPMREENRRIMSECGDVVLLAAAAETVYERVKDDDKRPILNGNMNVEFISQLMEKRSGHYQAAANIKIETDNKDIESICKELLEKAGIR